MIDDVCAEVKNYFIREILINDYAVIGGVLTPSVNTEARYIRIVGSMKNDGVHDLTDTKDTLTNESTFHGAVWIMAVPQDFIDLYGEIKDWQTANGGVNSVAMSPFQSESFGGYSYSKGAGGSGGSGKQASIPTWQSMYASRLNKYRRVRIL